LPSFGAELASFGAELSSFGAELASFGAELSSSGAELASFGAELSSSGAELASFGAELSSCEAELVTSGARSTRPGGAPDSRGAILSARLEVTLLPEVFHRLRHVAEDAGGRLGDEGAGRGAAGPD